MRLRFYTAVALQIVALMSMAAFKQKTLWSGQTILLATAPIDPRDVFRGDYVRLHYEISPLPAANGDLSAGDEVYVILKPKDGRHVIHHVSKKRPRRGVWMRGVVVVNAPAFQTFEIEYGIEKYFVPEHRGREIERLSGKSLRVEVAVDDDGNSAIRRILVDGEPLDLGAS